MTVALSSLGLHEGTWLGSGPKKEHFSFFQAGDGSLDSDRPFLSTHFELAVEGSNKRIAVSAGTDALLALGILLLEIHLARSIQSYRTADDLVNGQVTAFTDFGVAHRLAEKLESECSANYNRAIQSCLNPTWLPGDQVISLEDPRVRQGVCADVIQPLKEELEYLFNLKW